MNAQTVQEEPSNAMAPLDKVEDSFSFIYAVIGVFCILGVIAIFIKSKN
jgi:hypothetical protein